MPPSGAAICSESSWLISLDNSRSRRNVTPTAPPGSPGGAFCHRGGICTASVQKVLGFRGQCRETSTPMRSQRTSPRTHLRDGYR